MIADPHPDAPLYASARDLVESFRRRERSPVEVARGLLERIESSQPRLNAFVTVTADLALQQAAAAERAYADGQAGPLAGVPVSIKDLVELRGVRCTLGSLVDPDRVSVADDPLAERVRAAGAVILGKTNTPEHGWKGETTNRVAGSTHNPWRHGLTAGGSSGGAAAAVAAGLGPLAQGGDGAGSIRIPAAFSGVFGIKPTTGLVPQPTNSGLSSQGPLSRSVWDAALLLEVMARVPLLDGLDAGIAGCRVAWSPDLGYAAVEPDVVEACQAAAQRFGELGCEVEAAGPDLDDPWPIVETIWSWNQAKDETEATLELIDQGRRAVVERGWRLSESEHEGAQADRERYADAMQAFFGRFDLLLTPTVPITAFPTGLDQPGQVAGRPTEYLSWTAFTYPFNVAGQPAASVPCGFVGGLPVGLQIVGRRGADALVLRAARAFEQLAPWPSPATDLV